MKKDKLSKKEMRGRVDRVIEEVGLEAHIRHKLYELSGGKILELGRELNAIEQTTFIFSTDAPEVLKYAKNAVRIKDGTIVQ